VDNRPSPRMGWIPFQKNLPLWDSLCLTDSITLVKAAKACWNYPGGWRCKQEFSPIRGLRRRFSIRCVEMEFESENRDDSTLGVRTTYGWISNTIDPIAGNSENLRRNPRDAANSSNFFVSRASVVHNNILHVPETQKNWLPPQPPGWRGILCLHQVVWMRIRKSADRPNLTSGGAAPRNAFLRLCNS
jgi:hypothetical protein